MRGRSAILCVIVIGLTVLLSVRLFEIQINQSEVWADEAARLVRSGTMLPYRRGKILDVEDRVLVRDQATYRLELSYRDFRRSHVLGNIAHARSALEHRAVPLPEALEMLELWAVEFGELSPSDLDQFAAGAAIRTNTFEGKPVLDPDETLRSRRASDVSFYIASLFDLDKLERRDLKRLKEDDVRLPSYFELVAGWRSKTPEEVRLVLLERVRRSCRHLRLLAERLNLFSEDEDLSLVDPLFRIVDHLESIRTTVEELVAAALFREAAGFSPGRLDSQTLVDTIDVSWIGRSLYWDDDRIDLWTYQTRNRWLAWRNGYAVPRLLVEYLTEGGSERSPTRLLSLLGTIYSSPQVLEAVLNHSELADASAELAVLGRLLPVFDVEHLEGSSQFELSFDSRDFDNNEALPRVGWRMLEPLVNSIDTSDDEGQPDKQKAWRVRRLLRALKDPDLLSRFDLELVANEIVPLWEAEFQDALAEQLYGSLEVHAADDRLAPNGRLLFAEDQKQLATEALRDVLRDYGDRSIAIDPRPAYEAVYLLTRFPKEYQGFRAMDARVRIHDGSSSIEEAARHEAPWNDLAAEVIGSVSAVGVDEMQRQRRRENRMQTLKSMTRSSEEDSELKQLVGEVLLHDESQGVSGIEGEWDDYLRGKNGYREARGLVDRFGRGRTSSELSERQDGLDVKLTIDAELQHATEWMLEHPVYDPTDDKVDHTWFDQPVGAIVMLSSTGEVVVSASVPNGITKDNDQLAEQRADRSLRIDRTIRKPRFLPPGSVFKPFVALWALEHLGLDSSYKVECVRIDGQPAEYGRVRCWNAAGHGEMDLSDALKNSCNCYFAWLGESFPSSQVFRDMSAALGFGQPTGLRRDNMGSGLFEDFVPGLFGNPYMAGREASLAGNGLSVVEATPMQVARATLALATGKLHSLTNVVEVGGRKVLRDKPADTTISEAALNEVRQALYRVANEEGGTAYKALNAEVLGVEICVKTGSADLSARVASGTTSSTRTPKHTWVAGWLPPENPVATFVIFLDRAYATSSHTAVYVARQFLQLPETVKWLEDRGVVVERK
ncbi:MAG: cell division protein FtsI/penicillin-binding protein 2 [Planctomycetota bacterium]